MTAIQNDLTENIRQQTGHRSVRAGHDTSEERTLAESAAGNPEALRRLVDRHAAACLAVARQILRDEDMAQDAVQEAFLNVWRQAGRYDPGRAPIGPWLVMLSHHRAVDRVRREQNRTRPTDQIPDVEGDFDLEEHTITAVLAPQTVALLRQLPADQRQCLVLAYWGGYTTMELAKRLDISLATVKYRCTMALRAVRLQLHEQGVDVASDAQGAGPVSP